MTLEWDSISWHIFMSNILLSHLRTSPRPLILLNWHSWQHFPGKHYTYWDTTLFPPPSIFGVCFCVWSIPRETFKKPEPPLSKSKTHFCPQTGGRDMPRRRAAASPPRADVSGWVSGVSQVGASDCCFWMFQWFCRLRESSVMHAWKEKKGGLLSRSV